METSTPVDLFENLSLDTLRRRRSAKWATHPEDVLPAWVAEMDFPLAEPIRRVLREAIEHDDCGYPHPVELGEAFAGFAAEHFAWQVDPARVRLLPDVMSGVAALIASLTEPGDGVVINTPVYPPFFTAIAEGGRRVVEVPLVPAESGWQLDLDALESAFADGAAAYLLCSPHNPTGRVLARGELEAVAALSARYGVLVFADEIHAPMALPGATHTPYVTAGDAAAEHGVTLQSASRAWNVAGLRCAVAVAGSAAGDELLARLPTRLRYHAGHFGVLASVAAYREGRPWLRALVERLDANRRLLAELLEERLPAVGYVPPEAGYLAWLDCRALELGDDPAEVFLERGRVALSPGPNFGVEGHGFARLNFGTSSALLEEAVTRLSRAVSG
jgi:cystathionine beta-lyase